MTARGSKAINVEWAPATDDNTPADKIAYDVWIALASGAQALGAQPTVTVVGATSVVVPVVVPVVGSPPVDVLVPLVVDASLSVPLSPPPHAPSRTATAANEHTRDDRRSQRRTRTCALIPRSKMQEHLLSSRQPDDEVGPDATTSAQRPAVAASVSAGLRSRST